MTAPTDRFVGIGVPKDARDAHLRPEGATRRFDSTPAGTAALVACLEPVAPSLVVLEATGGYKRPSLAALSLRACRWRW